MELFQIWLNLPAADKMVSPHFTMFWADDIPQHRSVDANGRGTTLTVIAALPYQLGDIATIIPAEWKSRVTLAGILATATLKIINSIVQKDANQTPKP